MTAGSPGAIGPYTIDRELGRGGMGVVYLATDPRLDRRVAIKALPEHFAQEPERLARFEREAKTLAQLNHPNVAGIHGVEEHEGARYLVLEFVEGETLAARLDRGPMPVDESLAVAVQIAAGVEAAHESGVIHRDLKPGNIILTPDGEAKVLDFGLARTEAATNSDSSVSQSPTLTTPQPPPSATTPGAILGTAPYMSPEQARGRRVDKRSDIWSFGVILYEMLTGAGPFHGETVTDSIGAILHKDVDLALLPALTPRAVRHVIERCLERDRSQRLRDIGDARIEIDGARRGGAQDDVVGSADRRRTAALAIVAVALVFGALGATGGLILSRQAPRDGAVVRSTIDPGADVIVAYLGDVAGPATLSRDGAQIAFVAKRSGEAQRLYIRPLDAAHAEPIRGTDGATFPFWSWDGAAIGYFAGGDLRRYDLTTRTNRTICPAPGGRGGAWMADDTIVFAPLFQSELHRVPAGGGEAVPVTTFIADRHTSHRWPRPTPDGEGFTYIAVNHNPGMVDESAIYLSRPGRAADVEVTRAQYAASIIDGHLLVVRENSLYAAPIDAASGRLTGAERLIVEGVVSDLTTWMADFSAAANGALVFHALSGEHFENRPIPGGSTFGEAWRTTVIDRSGRPVHIAADGVPQNTVALSPDWGRLAISAAPGEGVDRAGFDIWIYSLPLLALERKIEADQQQANLQSPARRLTFMDGAEVTPVWSPDGEWIAFGRIFVTPPERWGLYRVRAGGGQPELLFEADSERGIGAFPIDWSPDGRYILFRSGSWVTDQMNDLFAFDVQENEVIPVVVGPGDQTDAEVSPDGAWLAYESNESGAWEAYVVPFAPAWRQAWEEGAPAPDPDARWRISIAGGQLPRWNPAGGELFYISSSDSLISVDVSIDGPAFTHAVGMPLFDARAEAGTSLAVAEAGGHFLINSSVEERQTTITLLMHWQSLLGD